MVSVVKINAHFLVNDCLDKLCQRVLKDRSVMVDALQFPSKEMDKSIIKRTIINGFS